MTQLESCRNKQLSNWLLRLLDDPPASRHPYMSTPPPLPLIRLESQRNFWSFWCYCSISEWPTSAEHPCSISGRQQNSASSKALWYCLRAAYASARERRATAADSGSAEETKKLENIFSPLKKPCQKLLGGFDWLFGWFAWKWILIRKGKHFPQYFFKTQNYGKEVWWKARSCVILCS